MLYCVRVKTVGFSSNQAEYFLRFEGQAVRTVSARHDATEFHLQEAVDTLEKLKKCGIEAEVCESIWGETKGQPFKRTPIESAIPSEWQWLIPLLGTTADNRVFLQANGQTVYASNPAELVQKVDALADGFKEWRDWLAQNKPAPEPIVPPQKKWYGVQGNGGQPVAWFPSLEKAEAEAAKLRARLRPADQTQIKIVETV